MMYAPSIFDDRLMDSIFDGLFETPGTEAHSVVNRFATMKTDISEKDGDYHMEIEMPGYKKENITAELKNGYLIVTGKADDTEEKKDDKGNVIYSERHTGECRRSYHVGSYLDKDDIKAGFENGILTLDFPSEKKHPQVEEKKYIAIS